MMLKSSLMRHGSKNVVSPLRVLIGSTNGKRRAGCSVADTTSLLSTTANNDNNGNRFYYNHSGTCNNENLSSSNFYTTALLALGTAATVFAGCSSSSNSVTQAEASSSSKKITSTKTLEELKKEWNEFHLETLKYNDDDDDDDDEEEEEEEGQKPKKEGIDEDAKKVASEASSSVEGDTNDVVDSDDLPIYRMSDVSKHDGKNPEGNGRIWMAYGGMVYDVTDFIPSHPGGSEKILLGAGQSIEPYWNLYRQHFSSDLPMKYLESMVIGQLHTDDQDIVDTQMETMSDDEHDPYRNEPSRHPALILHGETPANGEVPHSLLTQSYITPADLFYIRNHQPVPLLSDEEKKDFRLTVDLTSYQPIGKKIELSLDDIKTKFQKTEVMATLQCSGNRRSGFNDVEGGAGRTSGTPWYQGAISNATWAGVSLRDVLNYCGVDSDDMLDEMEGLGYKHLQFKSLDDFHVSIGLDKATSRTGDVIIAYEMNGQPLPRDHGYPLRMIVPGYIGVRNIKWINNIKLCDEEADSPYQRGLNYKILPHNITNAKDVDLSKIPTLYEASLFSGITEAHISEEEDKSNVVHVCGWAWAGGGRNIARVDVTCDGGKTWIPATLKEGCDQPYNKAWAWVFWTAEIPKDCKDGDKIILHSKAIDNCYNSQPECEGHMWNLRGLSNNSWFQYTIEK